MTRWVAASVLFFAYVIVVAAVVPRLTRTRRVQAAAGAALGLALSALTAAVPYQTVLHDWILPPVLLLLAYWSSGLLFAGPMAWAEATLESIDAALAVDAIARNTPRWIAEVLEAAYAGVYPLIPIAFGIHTLGGPNPNPERFWTVILVTDYICFGLLPWVQTRPPRAFRTEDPWRSRIRAFNLRLLGRASIKVNTFPSGHAAEALAAALLVSDGRAPLALAVAVAAVLVTAGTVLGRYHYAADAIAGWAVALGVWLWFV